MRRQQRDQLKEGVTIVTELDSNRVEKYLFLTSSDVNAAVS
jgi:hypothetical protein